MESARHEGVVAHGVGEDHKFGAPEAVGICGEVSGFTNDFAHAFNAAHVNTGAGRTNIHRRTHDIGLSERSGNRIHEHVIGGGSTFVDQRAESADKVHAHGFCCGVECASILKIFAFSAGRRDHGNWGYGNALIHDRYAQLNFDTFTYAHQVFSAGGDFVVDFAACHIAVRVGTVQERDAHGNGADIEFFFLDHADGFEYLVVHHKGYPAP